MVSEATDLSGKDADTFINQVIRLRQVASHGKSRESLYQPIAHPVSNALQSLCILYDFKCSGMSKKAMKENRILAVEAFRQSVSTVIAMAENKWGA